MANPIAQEETETIHDLEPAEHLLEIIEKKIVKLYKVNIFFKKLIDRVFHLIWKRLNVICRNVWNSVVVTLFPMATPVTDLVMNTDTAMAVTTETISIKHTFPSDISIQSLFVIHYSSTEIN